MAKLVRDKIPELISKDGRQPHTHIADDAEYWTALKDKLTEEVREFLQSDSPEELADILEVVHAICDFKGLDFDELERLRIKKASERGGFGQRIILDKISKAETP